MVACVLVVTLLIAVLCCCSGGSGSGLSPALQPCMDATEGEALGGCLQRVLELMEKNGHTVSIGDICNPGFNFRRLYLKMSVKYHPDKGGDPEDFKALRDANEFVNDYVKNAGHRDCCVAFVLSYCADPEACMQNIRAQQAKFDEEAKQKKQRRRGGK